MTGTTITRLSAAAAAAIVAVILAACGGGGSSTPTGPAPPPVDTSVNPCAVITTSAVTNRPAIVNGNDCRGAVSSVVLVNLRDTQDIPLAACSGTVIAPRAVLTAAHCLENGVGFVRIYLGTGPEIVADSFAAYPGYREGDPNGLDVGVVLFSQDIGRTPTPVLLSRDARVGETAVIAGWGNDSNQNAAQLRAGAASITVVGSVLLQTQFTTTASSVCQGDSGGPLLLQEQGVWSVAGIISANTTTACASGANYYANVRNPSISAFILSHVPTAAQR